jgi:acetate kinase
LQASVHFAPLHIPIALECIKEAIKRYPSVPQFGCFDTAFHNTIPRTAATFPLPIALFEEGVRRYGFHGLSYESVVHQLGQGLPDRTVIAHLGNGASLAAIRNRQSVDTTMGFTPTGGIPMATRSGDLDPGVILYLQRTKGMNADSLEQLLNHDSGLRALSRSTGDMRDLEAGAHRGDQNAQLAVDVFCSSIRKVIAAYSTVLGGLDMLVFTGGIGENSATIRAGVCDGLSFMGVFLDDDRNKSQNSTISSNESNVVVRTAKSQENLQIARHCRAMMQS